MKTFMVYVCDVCEKESRSMAEIELCEGRHRGLNSIEEIREYESLLAHVKRCSYRVSQTCNEKNRADYDDAIEKILEFENVHNMHRQ